MELIDIIEKLKEEIEKLKDEVEDYHDLKKMYQTLKQDNVRLEHSLHKMKLKLDKEQKLRIQYQNSLERLTQSVV